MSRIAAKTVAAETSGAAIDPVDRALIKATQQGLPLDAQPYHRIAEEIGIEADEVIGRLQRLLEAGIIRRIGVVPNHYALGMSANGMTVWDVDDAALSRLGRVVGALDFVSHCYHRPRIPPHWSYNLFAMVHGADRDEVAVKIDDIARLLGDACRGHEVLYSKRILKKTGMRLVG